MVKSLSRTATDWREGRRLRAWELKQEGWKQSDIAKALGVTEGAVSQWCTRAKEEGVDALYRHPAPGAKPRLDEAEKARLLELLAQGAEAFGFRGDIWTLERIAEVIRREFGVSYHPSHIGRILRACGWSRQKPVRRARQRDEAAMRQWAQERWPEIQKGA